MNSSKRRFALIAGTVAAVMVGTGIGVAYWTTTSPPVQGSAEAGTVQQVTIAQLNEPVTGLTPGGLARPIDVRITNTPATFPQRVEFITVTIDSVTLASSPPSGDVDGLCPASEFEITPGTPTIPLTPPTTISGGASADFLDAAQIALTDTGENQNACQGATVNLSLQVVG
jgi:hypothetical protein